MGKLDENQFLFKTINYNEIDDLLVHARRKIKAKIIRCSRTEPRCWYKNKIGDVIEVYEKLPNKNIVFCDYEKNKTGKINVSDLEWL